MSLAEKLFGSFSDRELKKINPITKKVLALETKYQPMSDAELQAQTPALKERLANGETLDDILPDAFAVCREAAWRVLGMKHFPVQIMGGIALHRGSIAEMQTGEGKTLVATLPAYLNALTGEGVHIVTVNDYLAKRDSEWMGKLYRWLGLNVGLIVQGRKESVIGREIFRYGELDCLVNGVDMPSESRILGASPEQPLLAVSLVINRALATELASVAASSFDAPGGRCLGVSVARVEPDVHDAFARLVDLLDRPEEAALMAPLLVREVLFRVLAGPQGGDLRRLHTVGSHGHQVAEAIIWLRANYMRPLSVDALAARVAMATSTFHRQFKKVTSLSPLQFQKRLRLYEAQRLMLSRNLDANHAGRAVGYESSSQFSREYSRLFGAPPRRDLVRMLGEPQTTPSSEQSKSP